MVPGIDDGSANLAESITMVRMALRDGTTSLIATPHQLGKNRHVSAEIIRDGVRSLQTAIDAEEIPVVIRPGADVRIDPELPKLLKQGKVLTLADQGKHVLLELPHDTYYPVDQLLKSLRKQGLVGILSHPERNRGIMKNPDVMWDVIEAGGLLQITAASLTGLLLGRPAKRLQNLLLMKGLSILLLAMHMTQNIGLSACETPMTPFVIWQVRNWLIWSVVKTQLVSLKVMM